MNAKSETVGESLYWAYANLAMAEMAVKERDKSYRKEHYMVRARLYKGLSTGTMSLLTLFEDQKVRMRLPMECAYCGAQDNLTVDHIIPINRGGNDSGDNAIWACRSCNASKADRDLFAWWQTHKTGFPPLFLIRIYLKQAIAYFIKEDRLHEKWTEVSNTPFDLSSIPQKYPTPELLRFTFYHEHQLKPWPT